MQAKLSIEPVLERFQIAPYSKPFAAQISMLFHLAVHAIGLPKYSSAQRRAWSNQPRSAKYWDLRLSRSQTWVMLDFNPPSPLAAPICCGFINVETQYFQRGYIDSLYVHPAYQWMGFAHMLLDTLIQWTKQQGYHQLSVDASYLSKPIFERAGFELMFKSYQPKSGQMLPGFHMQRVLSAGDNSPAQAPASINAINGSS